MRSSEKLTTEYVALLHDLPFSVSGIQIARDISTLVRRVKHEGESFLTKTLPALGKVFDRALSGLETFKLPKAFKGYKKSCIPEFLGAAFRKVFDAEGRLIPNCDSEAIRWLRTFLFYAYKLEQPFSEEQKLTFSEKFCSLEEELNDQKDCAPEDVRFRNVVRGYLSDIFESYVPGVPTHGPGISSDVPRLDKWASYCPPSEFRSHFGREFFHTAEEYWLLEEFLLTWVAYSRVFAAGDVGNKIPACAVASAIGLIWQAFAIVFLGYILSDPLFRVENTKILFVPKDSRGPRVIGAEPALKMYAQQGVAKGVKTCITHSPLTQGLVNFDDQTINQRLTFDSSNATLDLKDASDRVSLAYVEDVFPENLLVDLLKSRTSFAQLPDGRLVFLNKFAPMGSALCFPIMAVVVWTAIAAQIYLDHGVFAHRNTKVFVYGDDVIVPNEWAESAIKGLVRAGLEVNTQKSFINSRFRESCGQDTFDQATVTPLRRRKPYDSLEREMYKSKFVLTDNGYITHTVALANSARAQGYKNLASVLFDSVESRIGRLPYGVDDSPYLCRICSSTEEAWRNNQAESIEISGRIRAYVVKDREGRLSSAPNDLTYYRRRLLSGGVVLEEDENGVLSYTRPTDVTKLGLRAPYYKRRVLIRHFKGAYVSLAVS